MITDGAPQHRSKLVREEIRLLGGLELEFFPPGCPGLNAIEGLWRQMKHVVLDMPYVRFSSICGDIDRWLGRPGRSLTSRNTCTGRDRIMRQAHRGSCACWPGNSQ